MKKLLLFVVTLGMSSSLVFGAAQHVDGDRVQSGTTNFCSPATASGTTYACTLGYAVASYVTNARYGMKADVANTAAATINFNAIGAKTIKRVMGGVTTDVVANDICAGQEVELVYDGTNMQMVSASCATSGTGLFLLQTSPTVLTSLVLSGTTPTLDVKSNTTGQTPQVRVYSNTSTLIGHLGFNTQAGSEFSVIGDAGASYMAVGTLGNVPVQFLVNAAEVLRFNVTDLTMASGKNILGSVPTAQTIAATNTIAADACGGVKRITSAGAVTTNTTDTFTAPAASNTGCVMSVCNSGANNITLDNNAHFSSAGAADVVLTAADCVMVGSDGVVWRQLAPLVAN